MLSICLSLIITSLRPFTRKPFNYEGGSSHKSCSCIFSAKLSKVVRQAFLHPAIEHFGAGFRSGTGVGWGRGSRSVCFKPLPEGSPVMGRGGKLCILRTMEALTMKVGRSQGSSCRGSGQPRIFPAHMGRSFPVVLGQGDGWTSLHPRCESPGAREESSVTWPWPTLPGGYMRREAGTADPSPSSGDPRAVISPLLSAASSRPVGVAPVTSVHREALTWSG